MAINACTEAGSYDAVETFLINRQMEKDIVKKATTWLHVHGSCL